MTTSLTSVLEALKSVFQSVQAKILGAIVALTIGVLASNPWAALWLAGPLLLACLGPHWKLRGKDVAAFFTGTARTWRWVVLAFVLVAVLVFGFRWLDRHAELPNYDIPMRNWGGFTAGWQDGLHGVGSATSSSSEFAVLLLQQEWLDLPIESRRLELTAILQRLASHGVKGVALDVHMQRETEVDADFCAAVEALRRTCPVFMTYRHRVEDGELLEVPTVASVRKDHDGDVGCFTSEDHGHAMGFGEVDGVVRFVPLYFQGPSRTDLPSLNLRAARVVSDAEDPPPLVWLSEVEDVRLVRYEQVQADEAAWQRLARRFVFVGFENPNDHWMLTQGQRYGVEVHAMAAEAIVQGHFIRPTPNWVTLLGIVLFALVLGVLFHKGTSLPYVAAWVCATVFVLVLLSVLAMRFGRIWIDMPCALVPLLLLLGLGALGRRLGWTTTVATDTTSRSNVKKAKKKKSKKKKKAKTKRPPRT